MWEEGERGGWGVERGEYEITQHLGEEDRLEGRELLRVSVIH